MKFKIKSSIIVLMAFLIHLNAFAQPPGTINISESGNTITIDFQLPNYAIENMNIYDDYGINQNYSYINIDESFDVTENAGYPELPVLTLDLYVPEDAVNFSVATSSITTETRYSSYSIIPAQEDFYEDEAMPPFTIDNAYYQTNGLLYNFTNQVSEPYIVMGAKGISFSIFPFQYNPAQNKLTVIKSIRFTITHDGTTSDLSDISAPKDEYLACIFDNYNRLKSGSTERGRILMITDPAYADVLATYANYKRNIGYEVDVVTTDETGTSKDDIKNYITNLYYLEQEPTYILLVGDMAQIPTFTRTDVEDEEGENPGYDKRYAEPPVTVYPPVYINGQLVYLHSLPSSPAFIGRWSIDDSPVAHSGSKDLVNIINKSIYMETNLYRLNKSALLLAGGGDGIDKFADTQRDIRNDALEPNGFNCVPLYRIDNKTKADAIMGLDGDHTFFIYRGHAQEAYLDSDNNGFSLKANDINSSISNTYPFGFGFACQSGSFNITNSYFTSFCESWIRSEKGGITYFGASINTNRRHNHKLAKTMFDNLTKVSTIGQLTSSGKFKGNQRAAYNLQGDPSILLNGTGCINSLSITNNEVFFERMNIEYQVVNDIIFEEDAICTVKNGSRLTLKAGSTIKFHKNLRVEKGAEFKMINEPCN